MNQIDSNKTNFNSNQKQGKNSNLEIHYSKNSFVQVGHNESSTFNFVENIFRLENVSFFKNVTSCCHIGRVLLETDYPDKSAKFNTNTQRDNRQHPYT